MSIGDFPESLSQSMLVGTMLVGRLGIFLKHSDFAFKLKVVAGSSHKANRKQQAQANNTNN